MNDNSGFGGAVGLLVLLIAFGAMSNGNGGFLGGGNTAADTAALVEQNATAKQVAANGAALTSILERTGGITEAVVRGFDNVGNGQR